MHVSLPYPTRSLTFILCLSLLTAGRTASAQDTAAPSPAAPAATAPTATATSAPTGSTAFCLYELPGDDSGKRRWLNLGIVQYVESTRNELKIFYGGGNLGSGHEARIPFSSPEQLQEVMDRIRQTAANCR